MELLDANKLVLFVVFVVPGFVSLKTYQLLFQTAPRDASTQIVDAVAYSCLNYALLAWPILSVEESNAKNSSPQLYFAFYFFVLFVAPVALVCVLMGLRSTNFFQKTLPHPIGKPWDYVFGKRKPYWVIVTLKGQKKIAGRYDSESFTSSYPFPEQIYLQEAWEMNADGGFERPRHDSAGIMVLATEIESVELFNLKYGGNNVGQESPSSGGVSAPKASSSAGRESEGRLPAAGAEASRSASSSAKEAVVKSERKHRGDSD